VVRVETIVTLPNLFIVGAPRSGTTALFSALGQLPQVYVPSRIKEPHYYSARVVPDNDPRAIRDEAAYRALFAPARAHHEVVAEASPSYLRDPEAPKLIRRDNPEAKVIALLRDPVKRAHSAYLMRKRVGMVDEDFRTAVKQAIQAEQGSSGWDPIGLRMGMYASDVARYQATFGDAFAVYLFEELIEQPETTLRSILEFLGLDPSGPVPELRKENPSGVPRAALAAWLQKRPHLKKGLRHILPLRARAWLQHRLSLQSAPRPMPDGEAVNLLRAYYRDDMKKTCGQLGRESLPWPNFQE
jgi:hypothetical protein